MDLNKAMIIGRLTRDPEARVTPNGQNVTSFSVATNFVWSDPSGQRQEKTEFHNIVAWRKLAEICSQLLKKGAKVYVEGRLQTRDWTGQDGVKRYRTEIIAENVILLDRQNQNAGNFNQGQAPDPQAANVIQEMKNNNLDKAPSSPSAEENDGEEDEINIEEIPF